MSLPLSRKVEKAFAVGYLPTALSIPGLNIYEGQGMADKAVTPSLIVYSESSSPHPEMPVETTARIVRLRCKFRVDSVTNTREQIDAWREALETAMIGDLNAVQSALNKPASGMDARPVKGIHFHYVEMADDPSGTDGTDRIEDLFFNVTCELLDA